MTLHKKHHIPQVSRQPSAEHDTERRPPAPPKAEQLHAYEHEREIEHEHEHEHEHGPEHEHEREHEHEHEHEREHGEEYRADDRPVKVVERTWYYGCEEPCEDRRAQEGDERGPDRDRDHGYEDKDDGGRAGRPTRPPGDSNGRLGEGGPLTKGDVNAPNKPGVWVGPRADLDLPYLFIRANPADLGARPVEGQPFWESPDIFILSGVTPEMAPPVPPQLGQIALAGQPNTIYAHVWNFGKAAANEVVVEFYWVDPSLGISPGSVHLIAQTFMSLGAKGSGKAHGLVKCPEAWAPTFVNGGHECLLVRVWDNPSDLPGEPKFDARINRHVGQRNIHVVAQGTHMLAAMRAGAPAPALVEPILLKVGPLYGAPARVSVARVSPTTVPWLQLHTGTRGVFPTMAVPTGVPTLSPPTTLGGGFPTTGGGAQHDVVGDDQHVAFNTSDNAPGPGEAHVYRVSATQDGAIFGGYTVVLLG